MDSQKVDENPPTNKKNDDTKDMDVDMTNDERKCLLCNQFGDLDENGPGRLLYYRLDEWIHINCGLWSNEVYETMDGSLQNLTQAVSRSRGLHCSRCDKRGASVGCCHDNCVKNYHFNCGILAKADFKEDKTVYCYKHAQKYANKQNIVDFSVHRCVFVDRQPPEDNATRRRASNRKIDFRNFF